MLKKISKRMDEENFEDDEDSFILSFDEEGKGAEINSKKDYEAKIEKQQELTIEFINENLDLFKNFLDKKGMTEIFAEELKE